MNKINYKRMLLYASFIVTIFSCGDGKDEKTTTDTDVVVPDTSAATTMATPAATTNTIITTPQHMLIIRHKVGDFNKWLAAYESHDSVRKANGLHNYVIGRGVDDPGMVLVALKADDMAKAKAFAKDPGLKLSMQKGGVIGSPKVDYQTTYFQDTAPLSNELRSMLKMTVKDKDAWQKTFDDGNQERKDNGITTRVVGTDPDDNKKIMIVTAISDTAKANAYWKSDALKKRRDEGGVIGTPERFRFNVVKRY